MFIYYYGFDLIFILTLIITLGAQAFISGKYASTRRIITNKGMTGASIARKIMSQFVRFQVNLVITMTQEVRL